jgi:hypothetical protein
MTEKENKLICPVCKSACQCFYEDISSMVDPYHEFRLYCSNCGRVERANPAVDQCPYCGLVSYEHSAPPPRIGWNIDRFLPLFPFALGDLQLLIFVRAKNDDGQVILGYQEKDHLHLQEVGLTLSVPYNKDSEGANCKSYDSLALEFRIVEEQEKTLKIEVTIVTRQGYRYYVSQDDAEPPFQREVVEVVVTKVKEFLKNFDVTPKKW